MKAGPPNLRKCSCGCCENQSFRNLREWGFGVVTTAGPSAAEVVKTGPLATWATTVAEVLKTRRFISFLPFTTSIHEVSEVAKTGPRTASASRAAEFLERGIGSSRLSLPSTQAVLPSGRKQS